MHLVGCVIQNTVMLYGLYLMNWLTEQNIYANKCNTRLWSSFIAGYIPTCFSYRCIIQSRVNFWIFTLSILVRLVVQWFWNIILFVFLFISPWRWRHMWPKHFGGCPVMKQFQNIFVHVLVFILYSMYSNVCKAGLKTEIRISPWTCAQEKQTWLERIASDEAEPRIFETQRVETTLQLWNY